MTRLLLIRHGDITVGNKIPGRMNEYGISQNGINQIQNLGNFIKNFSVKVIYSSPLLRTMESSEILSKILNCPVKKKNDLQEINFGKWTNKTFDELELDPKWKFFHIARNNIRIPDGELMCEVQTRLLNVIEELTSQHQNEIIGIVSHNDCIKSIIAYYCRISLDLFLRIEISTGSLSVIDVDKEYSHIQMINCLPTQNDRCWWKDW